MRTLSSVVSNNSQYKSKYKKVVTLPIWKTKSNVSSVSPSSERSVFLFDEGPTLETLDFVGSISTFLYFDFYLSTANAAHYV